MIVWPVRGEAPNTPGGGRAFGASRDGGNRIHAGIDLYGDEGDVVVATESGTIVAAQGWAGPNAKAVLLQTDSGPVVLYGAVAPGSWPRVGTRVRAGDPVGRLGTYPHGSSMLHLEVYRSGVRRNFRWYAGEPKPPTLLDPIAYLSGNVGRKNGFPLALLSGIALVAGLYYGLRK